MKYSLSWAVHAAITEQPRVTVCFLSYSCTQTVSEETHFSFTLFSLQSLKVGWLRG